MPGRPFGRSGRADLFSRLPRYNQAAQFSPWLVLVDLESDQLCAPAFVQDRLPQSSAWMRFRVAVHAIESWLMADGEMLARYLNVSRSRMPLNPDAVEHPKRHLIDIARHSGTRRIREGLIPRAESGASQGPRYTSLMQDFVATWWRLTLLHRTRRASEDV